MLNRPTFGGHIRGESVGFNLLVFMFLGGAPAYYFLVLPLGSILRGISSAIL